MMVIMTLMVTVTKSVTKNDSIKNKAVLSICVYRSAIIALYKGYISHICPRDKQ